MQTFNQTLWTTSGGIPNSNIGLSSDLHDKIMDRQPASTLDTIDNQGQSLPPQKDFYNVDPFDQIGNDPIKSFEKNSGKLSWV